MMAEVKDNNSKPTVEQPVAPSEEAGWYVVRTLAGQENKTQKSFVRHVEDYKMGEKIFKVVLPKEEVIEMKAGKKAKVVRIFLPGYLLIQMNCDDEVWLFVKSVPGVAPVPGQEIHPQKLKEDEINRILDRMDRKRDRRVSDTPYLVGESVLIVDGPFKEFHGIVQEVNLDRNKVKVTVSIFGRATPLELDFLQIKQIT
jgi:transcription termination/antitermination protein NusG